MSASASYIDFYQTFEFGLITMPYNVILDFIVDSNGHMKLFYYSLNVFKCRNIEFQCTKFFFKIYLILSDII